MKSPGWGFLFGPARPFAGRVLVERWDERNGPQAHFLLVQCRNLRMPRTTDKESLLELLEPAVAAMGFELADLDAHFGRRGLLRLYIDRPEGVTVDDCQRVSEQVGALLDVEDPLPGSYVLEVSSPGFDRRLRTLAHFERFSGELAKVELKDAREGRRKLAGKLAGVEGGLVLLEVEGRIWRLPLKDIAEARLAPA
jgi:ribosome maturation factor RimP